MTDELALLIADIFETAGALRRWGERTAATEGQTQARWQVLSVLSGGSLTVPATARRLGISRQAVQRTVNELVDEGLAQVVANPDHRTAGLLKLTDHGRDVLNRITARATDVHRELFADLPPADLARTRTTLRTLLTRIRTADPPADVADPTKR